MSLQSVIRYRGETYKGPIRRLHVQEKAVVPDSWFVFEPVGHGRVLIEDCSFDEAVAAATQHADRNHEVLTMIEIFARS